MWKAGELMRKVGCPDLGQRPGVQGSLLVWCSLVF